MATWIKKHNPYTLASLERETEDFECELFEHEGRLLNADELRETLDEESRDPCADCWHQDCGSCNLA